MSGNLQEFMGVLSFVASATFFVVGLRWSILQLGGAQSQHHRTVSGNTQTSEN